MKQAGGSLGRRPNTGEGIDSIHHRTHLEDSISISYRYLDSTQSYKLDSSISDFYTRFPVPATHIHLGNLGNATRSLLFSPVMRSGFDPGFHAFDVYTWFPEQVRFYQTTRPYSELNYFLGTRSEQIIEILHTQNVKPNWNISFKYRLINSPGFFKSQKTNHNNYVITSAYQTKNKRYSNYLIILDNKLQSSENGGIIDTIHSYNYLEDPIYKDRFNIPTKLGGDEAFSANFFSNRINTGNKYNEFFLVLRQQYDLGRKDSLVTDSTVVPLFYPRLRFEHQFSLTQQKFLYQDFKADSGYYAYYYDTSFPAATKTFQLKDRWHDITNDFSIYQFPDAKNLRQFIKLGVMLQNLNGEFAGGKKNYINTAGHAEYRNKTRNQLWDIEATGRFYFTGLNAADYDAHISLQKSTRKFGSIQLGFENTSRTPSFIFNSRSSFYFSQPVENFKKENTTHLFASYSLPSFKFRITGHYYLLTNYTYLEDYYHYRQESSLFNVLQVNLFKTVALGKRWNWHLELYGQQVIGNGPVHLPAVFARSRIAYEGNLGFKNLDIAMGIEVKYRSPYKADGYSPVLGKFFYQDSVTIRNKLPDFAAYVQFRIKPFKFFVRTENLNAARNLDGFGFTNNNLVAPGYALPGLQIRLGVWWNFVN
jgi:hypothetical protein